MPESSLNVDGSVRYRSTRASASFTVFVNHIYDNIQKQTLILPQGAVGTTLGTEVITAQNANGAVFVAARARPCSCAPTSTTRAAGGSSTRAGCN